MKISEIFNQKLTEIQNRLPIPINMPKLNTETSFSDVLMDKINTNSVGSISPNSSIPIPIQEAINNSSAKYNIDPNLVKAVIKQESDFDPSSLSHAGAQGLMQLMPATAKILGVKNPWDVAQNIEGGVKFLKDQLNKFQSIPLALAAYNAGPGAVSKYNGIPPYRETQDYVNKVMQYYRDYSK